MIAHADSAFQPADADRLLLDGARRLSDARGLLRVAAAGRGEATQRAVLAELDRQSPYWNFPELRDALEARARMRSSAAQDEVALHAQRFLTRGVDLLRLAVACWNPYASYFLLDRVERKERITGQLAVWEIVDAHSAAASREVGDRLLLATMRHLNRRDDAMRLSERAHDPGTRDTIRRYAESLPGGRRLARFADVPPAPREPLSDPGLTPDDIERCDLEKIRRFTARRGFGLVHRSGRSDALARLALERLRGLRLAAPAEEIDELIERLER